MPNQYESEQQFSSREREPSRESKEMKEMREDPELQAAARMERADYLVKEVKSGKQQLQNIALNIAKVQQTLAQLRQLLGTHGNGDDSSIERDQAQIAKIKAQIAEHQQELSSIREVLVQVYIDELAKTPQTVEASGKSLPELAAERVDALIRSVQDDV